MVRPARLERATSWFVAVNTFVAPTAETASNVKPITSNFRIQAPFLEARGRDRRLGV